MTMDIINMVQTTIFASIVSSAIITIAVYILMAVFYMKLFAKANVPAWKAWVPVVNTWKFLELGGYPGAISILSLVGTLVSYIYLGIYFNLLLTNGLYFILAGDYNSLAASWASLYLPASIFSMVGSLATITCTVFMCMSAYQIGRKLGKEGVWVVLYIFLAIVWLGIMAFNKSAWNDSLGKPARGRERLPTWMPYGYSPPPMGGPSYY